MRWSVNYPRVELSYTGRYLGLGQDLNHATIDPRAADLRAQAVNDKMLL